MTEWRMYAHDDQNKVIARGSMVLRFNDTTSHSWWVFMMDSQHYWHVASDLSASDLSVDEVLNFREHQTTHTPVNVRIMLNGLNLGKVANSFGPGGLPDTAHDDVLSRIDPYKNMGKLD